MDDKQEVGSTEPEMQPLEVTFTLTKQDIWQMNKELVKAAGKLLAGKVRVLSIAMFSMYLLVLVSEIVTGHWTAGETFCVAASVCLIVVAYATPRTNWHVLLSRLANNPHRLTSQTVTLREGSFQACSAYADGIYDWAYVLGIVVTPGYISTRLRNGGAIVVPLTAFPDDLDRSRFEAFVRRKVGEADTDKLRVGNKSMVPGVWPPAPSLFLRAKTSFQDDVSTHSRGPKVDLNCAVHIACDVTNSDRIYFVLRSYYRQGYPNLLAVTFFVQGFFAILIGLTRPVNIPDAAEYLGLACIFWLLLNWHTSRSKLKSEAAVTPVSLRNYELTTDFSRIIINNPAYSVNYNCALLNSIEKTRRGIVLIINASTMYILPRNSFPDQQSFDNFYASMAKAIRAGKAK